MSFLDRTKATVPWPDSMTTKLRLREAPRVGQAKIRALLSAAVLRTATPRPRCADQLQALLAAPASEASAR